MSTQSQSYDCTLTISISYILVGILCAVFAYYNTGTFPPSDEIVGVCILLGIAGASLGLFVDSILTHETRYKH